MARTQLWEAIETKQMVEIPMRENDRNVRLQLWQNFRGSFSVERYRPSCIHMKKLPLSLVDRSDETCLADVTDNYRVRSPPPTQKTLNLSSAAKYICRERASLGNSMCQSQICRHACAEGARLGTDIVVTKQKLRVRQAAAAKPAVASGIQLSLICNWLTLCSGQYFQLKPRTFFHAFIIPIKAQNRVEPTLGSYNPYHGKRLGVAFRIQSGIYPSKWHRHIDRVDLKGSSAIWRRANPFCSYDSTNQIPFGHFYRHLENVVALTHQGHLSIRLSSFKLSGGRVSSLPGHLDQIFSGEEEFAAQ